MSHVFILGGHGKVALLATPLLVSGGHHVFSVIRNPDHAAEVEAVGADPIVADLEHLDTESIAAILAGAGVVVWSAGAGGGDPARTVAVDRDAAIRSFDAAKKAGVTRYIMVSYFGAGPDHGVPESEPFWHYAEAKTAADAALAQSSLDWTILRPSALTLEPPTGMIETSSHSAQKGSVSRADVAAVIAYVIDHDETVHRTIEFNNGATPIAEALAGS